MSLPAPAFAAATAVPIDAATERRAWFQALCDTYEADPGTTWDEFVQSLTAAAGQSGVSEDVVTEFARVMAEFPAPLDVLADMHQAGVDALDAAYENATVADESADDGADTVVADGTGEHGAPAVVETDPAVWQAALTELGARWDREEASWPVFREWFVYETGQRGVGAEGLAFVEYAEAGDKARVFDEYGIPAPARTDEPAQESTPDTPETPETPAVEEFPVVAEGDTGDWVAYADDLLTRAGY